MNEQIVVALVAFLGTTIGTFGGILASSKLTNFRLEQLEMKVDKHNNFATKIPLIQGEIEDVKRRISLLEEYRR